MLQFFQAVKERSELGTVFIVSHMHRKRARRLLVQGPGISNLKLADRRLDDNFLLSVQKGVFVQQDLEDRRNTVLQLSDFRVDFVSLVHRASSHDLRLP